MSVTLVMRITALFLLFAAVANSKAAASAVPWCAPEAAILTFQDQKGHEVAKVELRSAKSVCSTDGAENAAGLSLERSIRIEHRGQSIDVPSHCASGVSFRLDELALSIDHAGVGIRIVGKSTGRDEKAVVVIYKIGNKISCAQG